MIYRLVKFFIIIKYNWSEKSTHTLTHKWNSACFLV